MIASSKNGLKTCCSFCENTKFVRSAAFVTAIDFLGCQCVVFDVVFVNDDDVFVFEVCVSAVFDQDVLVTEILLLLIFSPLLLFLLFASTRLSFSFQSGFHCVIYS